MEQQYRRQILVDSPLTMSTPCIGLLLGLFAYHELLLAQEPRDVPREYIQRSEQAEKRGLAEPFKGVTTNGDVIEGLFPIRSTGVSTGPVRKAANNFLGALTDDQRKKTLFPVDALEWRKWMNQHFYLRQGIGFNDMSAEQRTAALDLLRASLSAEGFKQSRDIMRLNHTLAEINNNNFQDYGEWLYWITVMGEPSKNEPWGWQIDGHHLIINYFVLGDQVVMTSTFMGSEPVTAQSGKYAGTKVLQKEQDDGLAFINALDETQRNKAIIQSNKTGINNISEAFKDNIELDYAGIRATSLNASQQEQLLYLVDVYISNMREGHAEVRMKQIRQYLDETYFAWIGGTEPDSTFYYRIHSPVILIEFDHQPPIALPDLELGQPTRQHIHTVVRTPNGNDYGKDLLRQHYKEHPHPHRH